MKLFLIDYCSYHDDYSIVLVGNSKQEAEDKAIELDDQCYSATACEIDELDGYKITVTKI